MSYAIILAICVFGITLMYTSVPDDPKSHGLTERTSKEQETIHAMERIIVPLTLAIIVILVLLGICGKPDLYTRRDPDGPARHHRFY